MTTLNISIYELFLYLANATMRIPDDLKHIVFQDMASKLIEWDNVERDEVRKVLLEFDIKLDEICESCNEPLPDHHEGEAKCTRCSSENKTS